MLSRPEYGWTAFSLDGIHKYRLSFVTSQAIYEWIEEAARGLNKRQPFCVEGFMEPWRFICTVSYWNCHVIVEDDEDVILNEENTHHWHFHINMLDFCRELYKDIQCDIEGWAEYMCYSCDDEDEREALLEKARWLLTKNLEELRAAIEDNASAFGAGRGFL